MLRRRILQLLAILLAPFVRRQTSDPPRNILFLKPDHLGDVLLATPALRALRERFPDARIVALVGPWSRAALEHNPDIDELRTLVFPGFSRAAKGGPLAPYALLGREALGLRRERFDLALVGRDDHWWGALLALAAGVPARVGFAHPLCAPLLSRALPYDSRQHVAAQGLELAGALQARGERQATWFTPSPAARAWATDWLAARAIDPARLVVIHPGTGGASKHWLAGRWSEVAGALRAAGWQVVLTGGPGEQALVAEVARGVTGHMPSLAGQTSVDQLGALLARARLVLGVDSGPLHLAAAVGAATLRLYGPSDPQRFGPWGEPARQRVLCADLWCAPCGVFSHCPRGTAPAPCMALIEVEAVLVQARALLLT
jgi:ADP-heptose:LPS heptosyltransferase